MTLHGIMSFPLVHLSQHQPYYWAFKTSGLPQLRHGHFLSHLSHDCHLAPFTGALACFLCVLHSSSSSSALSLWVFLLLGQQQAAAP